MGKYFWEGNRVYLRPFEESDITDEYISWLNDSDVTTYLGETVKLGSTRATVQRYIDHFKETNLHFLFAIILKEGDLHIGNITMNDINWIDRYGEMGTLIGRKEYWGNGYGTEAKSLMIDFTFKRLGLHKIISGHVADNIASIKGNQRLGFKIEGTFRKHVLVEGEFQDITQMGLFPEEFTPYTLDRQK